MSGCFCLFLDGETSPESIACRKAAGRLSVFGTGWFLSILLSVSLGQSACAENLNWTGAGGGSWSASTNWAPSARVPDAGDDVLINSDGPVVVTNTSATANSVTVGQVSSGTLVINGSLLSNSLSLGVAAAIGGTVTFSGATLQNQGLLSVGGNGIGTLSLLHGSAVSTGTVYIGEGATGNGFLTLDNSSSLVTAGTIFVGYGGGSAPSGGGNGELKILAGSTVDSQRAILGEGAGTEGATLISGAGSRWTVAADTVIGNAGVSTLTVTGGGKLLSGTTTVIANLYSASGSEVTLTRLGSSLETGQLIVGNEGSARLTVEAAASATSDSAIIGRHSTSVATVTGDGSTWVAGDLQISGDVADPGGASGNGTLNVTAGGKVNSTAARLGTVAGATGAVIIDGEGSAWTVGSGGLAIGDAGTGSLAVTGGGIVGSQAVVLGNSAASTGSARISGVGSTLRSEGDIIVGRGGNAMMSVEAGGAVESRNGVVAALGGSSSSVTVTGGGSSWTMTGTLIAGYQDTASAEVTASAGGNIRAGEVVLGDLSRSSGTMTITGASSNVTAYVDSGLGASGRMTVGQSGSGGLTVTNGASLNAYLFSVGSSAGSDGAVLVNGIGSRVSVGDRK
ncbi:MAG TPA: autotransporter outer membrane beta-barrel domain-containing protein, partial [Agrobacterium sp.]|nr:autotransporter outer membrane beta-barrel domain-containing protein [Agrobacterium sp.]